MKYMGSKAKYATEILSAITNDLADSGVFPSVWVEPFVGGCNMIDKVGDEFQRRIGNDINAHLIEMFRQVQSGWEPPVTVDEGEYSRLRALEKSSTPDPLIGFVGVGCSYSGKWFGGYARGNANNGRPRNYCKESRDNLLAQRGGLQGVELSSMDYRELAVPTGAVVYCDPPYAGATKYKSVFDHEAFWEWCLRKHQDGHPVYVSEYHAPVGWATLWEREVNNSLTKDTGSKRGVERLFTYRP